jgi:hypothetical protein
MSNDFDESEKTTVDWDRKLADFMVDAPLEPESICSSHDEGSLTSCDACEQSRCIECLDICPCVAMEDRGIYLSFGSFSRCCFCGAIHEDAETSPYLVHARARWGHAYAHTGCIGRRAEKLRDSLDEVLAAPEPLSDVFSLVFDQVMPELFVDVDRNKIMLWCELQEAEVH